MIAKRIRERCEQFARDENVYECGHPENGDYVKVESLVSLCSELLAEKDQEIAYLNMRVDALRRFLCSKVEKTEQYQQLMAQAVRFAQYIYTTNNIFSQMPIYKEAELFLKEHHDTRG